MEAIIATVRAASARREPETATAGTEDGAPRPRWDGLEELRPALQRFLAHRCRDQGELDDVVQETFLRAARYRGSLAHPQKLRGWALRIAMNVLRDLRRREEPTLVAEEDEDPFADVADRQPGPAERDDEPDLRLGKFLVPRDVALAALGAVLRGLGGDERRMLAAYYGPGGGARAAAVRLAVPRELVKVRVFRLRRRLHARLLGRLALSGDRWIDR